MLTMERWGRLTYEISALLIQAIVLPLRLGTLRRRRKRELPNPASAGNGCLVLVGGRDIPDDVVVRLIHLAGGRRSPVTVIAVAGPGTTTDAGRHARYFARFGVDSVSCIDLRERHEAEANDCLQAVLRARLVLLTASDTDRLLGVLHGTRLHEILKAYHRQGGIIATSGAGTVAAGTKTLVRQRRRAAAGPAARGEMRDGLGFLAGTVVDRDLAAGGWLNGLSRWLPVFPDDGFLSISIEEKTAVIVGSNHDLEVVGENGVVVADGRDVERLATASENGNGLSALTDLRVHFLPSGCRFDLASRRPLMPRTAGKPAERSRPR